MGPLWSLRSEDALRQVFEIHLVDDAGAGGDDAEVVERILTPAQEFVTLTVPRKL